MQSIIYNYRLSIVCRQIPVVLLLLISGIKLGAQQQIDPTAVTQEIDYRIDRYGDAHMELRQKMTAAQWQNFKSGAIAQNPSVFKRDLERSMTTLLLEDFKNELKEDSRTSVTQLTARSMAVYKGNGKWELKLDSKSPNITKISDNVYMMTNNLMAGGNVIQQLQKIFFPAGASQIKQDTDNYGNAVFTYMLEVETSAINFLLWLGIVLMAGGAGWMLWSAVRRNTAVGAGRQPA